MNRNDKEYIKKLFQAEMEKRDQMGRYALSGTAPDFETLILQELTTMERLSAKLSEEFFVISEFVRKNIWKKDNSIHLYKILHSINQIFKIVFEYIDADILWPIDFAMEYAQIICKLEECCVTDAMCNRLLDDIEMAYPRKEVPAQWNNILYSDDGQKSFQEVFDDIFVNAIEEYPDIFISGISTNDILYRMVKEKNCSEDRFIPWPNKVQNRWNPPGKTFLYMSFGKTDEQYDTELSLGEYVCLLECRTVPNTDCSFCKFEPTTRGKIIDLSYNDVELFEFRNMIDEYEKKVSSEIISKLLSDKKLLRNTTNKSYIKKRILEEIDKKTDKRKVITASFTKQYLKIICSCIYKKIDGDESEKERAYRSFHILAEYLISKGITGIIYPCTRDETIKGKNIVLFNIQDAKPISGTIKRYRYSGD